MDKTLPGKLGNPNATFERIRYLATNYTAYVEMATRPVFKPRAMDAFLSLYPGDPLGGTGLHGVEIRKAVDKFLQTDGASRIETHTDRFPSYVRWWRTPL